MAKKRQILVAGVGLVDPKIYAFTDRAVRVMRAYGPFSVGTVIPAMPGGERAERLRCGQVAPFKLRRQRQAAATPAAHAPAAAAVNPAGAADQLEL